MSQDVELWKRELVAAGWRAMRSTIWRAPCGCLHLGPYGAWCKMLAMRANELPLCPVEHLADKSRNAETASPSK